MKEILLKFIPTKWDTAEEKLKFYQQFIRFVERGMLMRHFTLQFYDRLHSCFGHIVHHNAPGFWDEWFSNPDAKCRFLVHTISYSPVGDPAFTYSDVETAIQRWLADRTEVLESYRDIRNADAKQRSLELLQALIREYPQEAAAALGVGTDGRMVKA